MNNLRYLRNKVGLSQENVAHEMQVSQQAIAKWENGDSMPRADKLPELARILNCTISDLFDNETA